jgi:SpoVK/Ycf46/Vps4 family AAA+-type ATPase
MQALETNLTELRTSLNAICLFACCRVPSTGVVPTHPNNVIASSVFIKFDEVYPIPLPTNVQRKKNVKYIVRKVGSSLTGSTSSPPDFIGGIDVDRWADQLVALPVAKLSSDVAERLQLHRLTRVWPEKLLSSFKNSVCFCYNVKLGPRQIEEMPLLASSPIINIESKCGLYGHKQQLQTITESILWPRQYAYMYKAFQINPEIGILLFGPPGTGKTMLPGVISTALKYPLISIRLCDVVKGTIGSGERAVRELFREARRMAPSIIFIDEFQSIFTARTGAESSNSIGASLAATLSSCFDDVETWNRHGGDEAHIVIIAATNEPWALDQSFLRPGRFGLKLYVGALDLVGRTELLTDWYAEQKHRSAKYLADDAIGEVLPGDIEWIAELALNCESYSAADVQLLIHRVCLLAFEERVPIPTPSHFRKVLLTMKPSISQDEVQEYQSWLISIKPK